MPKVHHGARESVSKMKIYIQVSVECPSTLDICYRLMSSTHSPIVTSTTPNSSNGSLSPSKAHSDMGGADRRRDDGKSGSASPLCGCVGDAGSTPLPLASGARRCTGAAASGMAMSTHMERVAASFSERSLVSGVVVGIGDAMGDWPCGRGEREKGLCMQNWVKSGGRDGKESGCVADL